MTKRILTLVLAACLLIVPVFADDADSVAVSTLEELQAAITAAQDGDTIILTEIIMLSEDAVIGEEGKRVKLVCEGEFARNFINIYSGNIILQGLIFEGFTKDGAINHMGGVLTCRYCDFLRCRTGVYSYDKPEEFEDCRFETCYFPVSGANDLTMQNCSIINCTGSFSCISACGNIVIDGCRFEKNIVPADTGALFVEGGNAQITNSAFIGNHAIMGRGAAIYSDGDITISGCVFHDNRAGTEGNDLYIRNCDLTVADTAQGLEELYAVQSLDYTGIYTDYISARQGEALNLPLSYTLSNTDSTIAICFVSSELVEPTPTPEPVVKTETEYVYIPVYQTEIVEIEKIIEVEPEKETVELQRVTLQRNDDYMRGYFDSLKGQDATRADVAQLLYQIAVRGDTGEAADYGYTDIPSTAPYTEAVNVLSYAGLFCGCGNNRFEPDAVMTKGQISVIMARLLGLEPLDGGMGHWALPYLSVLQSNGIASDMSAADLNEPISMEELEAMIDRLFIERQENT